MVDFRYHLVSLISVFLALAVGIVLGAGPLKEPITGTLTAEVEQLRTERVQARADLAGANEEISTLEVYLDQVSGQVLSGLLQERVVAVVAIAQTNSTVADNLVTRLTQAGAQVGARLTIEDKWWEPGRADDNAELAEQLRATVSSLPKGSTASVLSAALWFALTDVTSTGGQSAKAETVLTMLADAGLVDADAVSAPVDAAVVFIDHSIVAEGTDETPATDNAAAIGSMCTELARAAALATDGSVFGGPAATRADPTSMIRSNPSLSLLISTVDDIADIMGQLSVPRALARDVQGFNGHYGTAPNSAPGPASDGLVPGYSPVPTPTPTPTVKPTDTAETTPPPSQAPTADSGDQEQAA